MSNFYLSVMYATAFQAQSQAKKHNNNYLKKELQTIDNSYSFNAS